MSREVEFAIPRELSQKEGIRLAVEFVQREFVDQGMIADLNVHWDIGLDGLARPHAHVLLTMREISENGFGLKVRDWNRREVLVQWREHWANHVNARLAELDIDSHIDHRSLRAQGIALEPENKVGTAASRMAARGLVSNRVAQHREIARRNGMRIIKDPSIALDSITHTQATFTRRDLAMFVHRHSDGLEQFERAISAVRASPDLVPLGKDQRGEERFTSRDMIATEARLERAWGMLAEQNRQRVTPKECASAMVRARQRGLILSSEQRAAFAHLTDTCELGVVVGYAGAGKTAVLSVAREAWESGGNRVRGLALSGIATENLRRGSGILSHTIASQEYLWDQRREMLTSRDVLVIDEAGMIGTRQMERVLSHAAKAGARVVLVGDPQQLQAIEAGAAFRAVHERYGGVEISEVRRQCAAWQCEATRELALGRSGAALHTYAKRGRIHVAETRDGARRALVERWDRERAAAPDHSRIILAHTNEDVAALNRLARDKLRDNGQLGEDVCVDAERGHRKFAIGDRVLFLRNESGLNVKNGTLATLEQVESERMTVRTDDGRRIAFETRNYAYVDHGYAVTVHKAQGMTVDCSHVLATPGMDRHMAYVALSRHRHGVQLHYGADDFPSMSRLARALSRNRAKDMASDYERREPVHAFAARRGIAFRERVAEFVQDAPERVRGIFANLRLRRPAPETAHRKHQQLRGSDLRSAVERYARAVLDITRMREGELPVLPHHRVALTQARDALATFRPDAPQDLDRAFRRRPELVHEAAKGHSTPALRAMQNEAEIRIDPFQRANRFVENWKQLQRQHQKLLSIGHVQAAQTVAQSMSGLAKTLERDPQLESLLRGRARELGLELEGIRKLSHTLAASVPLYPTRGRGPNI